MPATPEVLPDIPRQLDLLMPLCFFYERAEEDLPTVDFFPGAEMPEPQRGLLVHDSDMTPTLRDFHQSAIGLTVVCAEKSEAYVMRQVVLTNAEGIPVEYGAIGIHLDGFAPHVRTLIRSGAAPLGGILETEGVPHGSSPSGFFRIEADEHMAGLLDCEVGITLFGRCNTLTFPDGTSFADIVEVLPPAR